VTKAVVSGDYDNDISDQKCLKVTVKLKQHLSAADNQPISSNSQSSPNDINLNGTNHLSLTQGNLRRLINLEETRLNMMNSERIIYEPAYHYVNNKTMMKEVEEWVRKEKERTGAGAVRIRYRTK
jgi:hypothetical protein